MKIRPILRRASATDLSAIYQGELDYIRTIEPAQEEHWTNAIPRHLEQWTRALDRMFVLECEAGIAGYCFWQEMEGEAVLASIYVVPGRRREGLGRELLERFLADAREHRIASATLGLRANNPARRLYERMGFVPTHEANGYLHYRLQLTHS